MSDTEILTFGCRLNAFESEVMQEHARASGLADAVVVNTCAVTAEAVRQAAQAIRKLRRERPGVKIIVTGCAAQLDPQRFAAMPEVDLRHRQRSPRDSSRPSKRLDKLRRRRGRSSGSWSPTSWRRAKRRAT